MSDKLCKTCELVLPLGSFSKCSRRLHGHHYRCKKCENEIRKSKRAANIDRYRELERERAKRTIGSNRERVNKKRRKEWHKRSAEDPLFVLNNRVRRGVNDFLARGKSFRAWRNLLGYGLDELKVHLERQFVSGMSWENIGDWHVDHIIPLSEFKTREPSKENIRSAWALTNLRPLWAKDNLRKSNKRIFLI
jgi:5-methylcytosine-specific restriction endonuclease McrA